MPYAERKQLLAFQIRTYGLHEIVITQFKQEYNRNKLSAILKTDSLQQEYSSPNTITTLIRCGYNILLGKRETAVGLR
jgi:hypothetical protein